MSNEHQQRLERRRHLIEKRYPRYHVSIVRGEKTVADVRSNDLDAQIAKAKAKAPAYVVDNWARPTPEVVFVALADQSEPDAYMTQY